jgi:hypothetical protein
MVAMNDLPRSRAVWAWASLGLAGSLVVAFAGPGAVRDATVGWWYRPHFLAGHGVSIALLYAGMTALCVAWLGLGLGRRLPGPRPLMIIGAVWLVPLALAPPLFSRDIYSYLAQGTILHLGQSPYHSTPSALAGLGGQHVLAAVSPFWRHTTAPYGPLFLELISLIVGITRSDLVAGVLLTRVLELGGIVLLAIFVPRLARALGSDARRAIWLTLLSPLVLLELVAAGHNDLLMIGLLVAGVVLAFEGRPLLGIAVCALAATIKVPALAGAVFIAVAWARAESGNRARAQFLLAGALVAVGVLAAVTIASGVGVSWISTSLFSTPAKVRLAITPATGVGFTLAGLLHDVGIATSSRGVESALGVVGFALTAVTGVVLLHRVRIPRVAVYLGAFLLVSAAGGPAAWPWYFSWGLVLVAGARGPQRSIAVAIALAVAVFLVKPNGILALPLQTAPVVVVVYTLIGGATWYSRRRRDGDHGATGHSATLADGAPSALVRT